MKGVNDQDREDAGHYSPGLSLEELGEILEVYGAQVTVRHAEEDVTVGAATFRDAVKAVLNDEGSFLVVNFVGSKIGTTTSGHISPLGAYDEQTDSILVLDVAGHKNPWYWVPLTHLYQAMHTLAGDVYRGWLVVSDS
jgi:hypothetical protein